jgi:hypothetical protein
MRPATTFLVLLFVSRLAGAQAPTHGSYVPPNGFVPDSATAVRIALAVWTPIYGDGQFTTQHPVTATLTDGIWTVTGHVPTKVEVTPGPVFILNGTRIDVVQPFGLHALIIGDTAVVKIDKRDGRILYQGHS